jgi:hypothetical protein
MLTATVTAGATLMSSVTDEQVLARHDPWPGQGFITGRQAVASCRRGRPASPEDDLRDGQGVRVPGAQYPLLDGRLGGVLVAGPLTKSAALRR